MATLTFENIKSTRYQKYLDEAEERKDRRFNLIGLAEYVDQILAIYEEELDKLYEFIDRQINCVISLKKLKKYYKTRAKPEEVNRTLLSGQIAIDPIKMKDLFAIYVLAHKLRNKETLLKTNIRETKVIQRRIENLKIRNGK